MQTDVLKTREAAKYIEFGESTLERMRMRGDGPPFIKAGKSVRYRKADLDEWLESRLVRSTSETR